MLDDAFHGAVDARQSLLKVVGQDQDFVRRFLSESPAKGYRAVHRGFAALLDAAVDDRIPRQPAVLIEGEGEAQDFPLVIAEPERLAKLVFLNQLVDEGYR